MKTIRIFSIALLFSLACSLASCEIFPDHKGEVKVKNKPMSGQLLADWIRLHLKLIRSTTGVGTPALSRHFAYASLALYESIAPSDKQYLSLSGQLQGLTSLPAPPVGKDICWPASANAAMASMLRAFYANTPHSATRIDSLENAYAQNFAQTGFNTASIETGASYGKVMAQAILEYAKTDGFTAVHPPYVAPTGEGLWIPTPPAFAPAAVPYLGTNRKFVKDNIVPLVPPTAFSKDPGSAFYGMVKEVYDASTHLTEEQKTIAAFWEDIPNGKYYTASGHWASILRQVIMSKKLSLLESSVAYAKMCLAVNDAFINCFTVKYQHNLIRPVTYIRQYLNQPEWSSAIMTPNHPEYPSAHTSLCMAAATALSEALGNRVSFTDQAYSDVGFQPRHFQNFEAAAQEAGMSRFYGGIHYKASINAGLELGKKSAQNLIKHLQFRK
ncbi:vanadium-dependent haloperoxidase [Adhaeribacter pallidiroseus]|uniref:Uncharacterized protein n=1 Tax=Adhaeribacter pallidiroseus TaxID=2072847 RepID=A0A369QMF9_9BACT|nr:vanadium-dependent haloperoxidase [Adhaeribacter pallidiroseus]RDC65542.1 hypothetical protein AHMF7616_04172 [Adhaeribacter pallidiroseus]